MCSIRSLAIAHAVRLQMIRHTVLVSQGFPLSALSNFAHFPMRSCPIDGESHALYSPKIMMTARTCKCLIGIPGSQDRTSSVHHVVPLDDIFRKMSPAKRTSRHLRPFLHPFNLGDRVDRPFSYQDSKCRGKPRCS